MAYKGALIFCILLLSVGMFSLIIFMAYVDIIISNRHHITEILLKVALNTNKQTNTFFF